MITADNTLKSTLTLEEEFSQLISKITSKKLDFFTDDNIEILHDLRVDLRKLRTWLKMIEIKGFSIIKLYKHTCYCHKLSSELRNFDVLIHWINKSPIIFSPKLYHTLKHERKIIKKKFLKEFSQKKPLQKLKILGDTFIVNIKGITKEDFQPYAVLFIDKKRKALYRMLPKVSGDMKQLHKIRKLLKKERYAMQLLPTEQPQYQHSLKHLQEMLGYINDRRVWIKLIQRHLKKNKDAATLESMFRTQIKQKIKEFKTFIASGSVFF